MFSLFFIINLFLFFLSVIFWLKIKLLFLKILSRVFVEKVLFILVNIENVWFLNIFCGIFKFENWIFFFFLFLNSIIFIFILLFLRSFILFFVLFIVFFLFVKMISFFCEFLLNRFIVYFIVFLIFVWVLFIVVLNLEKLGYLVGRNLMFVFCLNIIIDCNLFDFLSFIDFWMKFFIFFVFFLLFFDKLVR